MTRRAGLWTTLIGLIALLLVAMVWLVGRYEQSRQEDDLERIASLLTSEMRAQLGRNHQRLQALSQRPLGQWAAAAQQILEEHPEMLRLEQRSIGLAIERSANSPFLTSTHPEGIYKHLARVNFSAEVNQACTLAAGYAEAAYSLSYFVPQGNGLGFEVTDFCLPQQQNNGASGYLIVTYSLQEMLKEWTTQSQQNLHEIALEEPDGSRLAATGMMSRQGERLSAPSLLDLQGLTLVLRVSRWFSTPHWMANTPTVLVLLLAMALGLVLWLLQRDMRKRLRTEAEFRQSQERLQRSARLASLGEMASMLSHELNQPLAAIASYATGSLNLMESEPHALDLFEIKTALERIASQSQRAGVVIKSVNDFVRRRETERVQCAPKTLFEGILPLLSLQARQLGIQVTFQVDDHLPAVWCDKTLIEQVLLNLARNGMQSMSDVAAAPHASKHLGLIAKAHGDSEVMFAVEDTGAGLSPETQERLFTPFFTTKSEGTGLGLSLCRTVIEQHGSRLAYTSEPSGGIMVTRFMFNLSVRSAKTQRPLPNQHAHEYDTPIA